MALVAALVGGGCEAGVDGGGDAVVVTDSAGITIITAPGDGLDRPLDVQLAAEPHLRIGSIDGGAETQLTAIVAVARLSDGRLMVAELGDEPLRIFSSDGTFLNWVGRVGQGPGEFTYAVDAGVIDGDTLWLYDARTRDLELYTPDGTSVRTFRPEAPDGAPNAGRSRMHPDGRVIREGTTFDLENIDRSQDFQEEVVVSVAGREGRDAVAVTGGDGATYTFPFPGTFTSMYDLRFASRPDFAYARDLMYRADPGPFEIREISYEGELLRILRIERAREPVPEQIIQGYEQRTRDQLREMEETNGRPVFPPIEERLANYTYADSLPHFDNPIVDAQGRLWVTQYTDHVEIEATRWWRIGSEGGVDGYLDVPERFYPRLIDGEEIIGTQVGDLDVPYLVAYHLVGRP